MKVDPANSKKWFSDFREIVLNNNIELIIPTVENELAELIGMDGLIRNVLMPRAWIVDTCLNKYKTAQFLNKKNIGVAKTALLEESKFEDKPTVIKPCSGRGSRVHVVATDKEFSTLKLSLPSHEWVCQVLEPKNQEHMEYFDQREEISEQ